MIVFEEYFNQQLSQEKWVINKKGHITGTVIRGSYHVTDTEVSWVEPEGNYGSQHEARVPLPDNFDIVFGITFKDSIPVNTGELGIAIVKKSIEGLEQASDNYVFLFVGQADSNVIGAEPVNYILSSHTINILDPAWQFEGGTSVITNPLSPDFLVKTEFKIEKRGTTYTIYKEDQPVASTVFDEECRMAILAGRIDPCLYFVEWAEIDNIILYAI